MFTIRSQMALPFLNPAWTSGISCSVKGRSFCCITLNITFLVWEIRSMVLQLLHSLSSPFLKIGMCIELFQSFVLFFIFVDRHILVRLLTDSVSVDWNNSIGIPSTPGDLFLPNIFRAFSTLLSRIIGFYSLESSSEACAILLFLLYRFSVYCFHLLSIFSWSDYVLPCCLFIVCNLSLNFPFISCIFWYRSLFFFLLFFFMLIIVIVLLISVW